MQDTAGSPERATWLHLARSGSQSRHAIWFILPARGASHIITSNYCLNCDYNCDDHISIFICIPVVQINIWLLLLQPEAILRKKFRPRYSGSGVVIWEFFILVGNFQPLETGTIERKILKFWHIRREEGFGCQQ